MIISSNEIFLSAFKMVFFSSFQLKTELVMVDYIDGLAQFGLAFYALD